MRYSILALAILPLALANPLPTDTPTPASPILSTRTYTSLVTTTGYAGSCYGSGPRVWPQCYSQGYMGQCPEGCACVVVNRKYPSSERRKIGKGIYRENKDKKDDRNKEERC
ncbi:hypothetical protein BJ508DRAFT_158841 [Ascobolus immersus RN42]|uniref:CBM1 domain-containing protein n=1 Tax=Ascobolus immersus RN42 TaxID=1160509 RepID=A0A3N4IIM7_ASCIM|nr:hypothetical protein BJ508DRAFT_158841 [Ascobolus immersus RN42]